MDELQDYVKIILTYDVEPGIMGEYQRFMLGRFIPGVQEMGLAMVDAWHTAYGAYPIRLIGFVAEDYSQADTVLHSEKYQHLEEKLVEFTFNFKRRIIPFSDKFQF